MILKFGRTERKKPLLTALPPQYFLWYTILLPFYLPYSSLLSSPRLGLTAAVLWIGTQVFISLPLPPTLLLQPNLLLTMVLGSLAPTSISTRIPRQKHVHTWPLRCRISILRSQLLDPGDYDWRYWGEGTVARAERWYWRESGRRKA